MGKSSLGCSSVSLDPRVQMKRREGDRRRARDGRGRDEVALGLVRWPELSHEKLLGLFEAEPAAEVGLSRVDTGRATLGLGRAPLRVTSDINP